MDQACIKLETLSTTIGDVFYRSKYLRSDTYKHNIEANRIVVSEFGTMAYPDPCKNIFSKAFSYLAHAIPDFTDNCLINIIKYGENFYASSEVSYIRRIDPRSLDTLEKVDFANYVPLNLATSHPHYDGNGNTYNIGTSIAEKGKTKYLIVKVPTIKPDDKNACFKNCEIFCSIPCHSLLSPSYYHSFGISENYIIFLEQPFKLDILKMATAYFKGVNWASCLGWHPKEKTYIHIIDRKTQKVLPTKFCTDALVVYHHVNAYEENSHLVFDIIAYEDNSLYEMFYLTNMKLADNEFKKGKKFTFPQCRRFVIPLDIDKNTEISTNIVRIDGTRARAVKEQDGYVYCTPEVLFEGIELPRINYDYNGKKYRYIYASKVQWQPIPTKIIKCDIQNRSLLEWEEELCWPAEPVFVKAPDAKEEDDGVLLSSVVTSDAKKSSFLLVLDAKTFKELGRASVSADLHLDLHGMFIPEKELSTKI
ncbi:beta,beta-carotene 15,15'-dioxygenase-like isoform X2 [Pristis pectinata]|uniref:beta,beta-carotene 15,15'-dioxygenase-like isoform X2 n=1 Tax=Pristis pectinata TaxID=685728 RepID=UPI00223DA406|nr:beta,beta-carotene 15,15'-dioxygenase-like isoform X2 [Pristis pectinata]